MAIKNFVTGVGKIVHALSEMTADDQGTWLVYLLKALDYAGHFDQVADIVEHRRRHGTWERS